MRVLLVAGLCVLMCASVALADDSCPPTDNRGCSSVQGGKSFGGVMSNQTKYYKLVGFKWVEIGRTTGNPGHYPHGGCAGVFYGPTCVAIWCMGIRFDGGSPIAPAGESFPSSSNKPPPSWDATAGRSHFKGYTIEPLDLFGSWFAQPL